MFAQPTKKHMNYLVSAAMVMTLVGVFVPGMYVWAAPHHPMHAPAQRLTGGSESRRPSPITPAQAAHAAALHNASTVVLAHDHVIEAAEFDRALAGGLSGLGLDIVAGDGQEFVNGCRLPRSPIQIFNIYDRNLTQLNAIVASANKYRIARTVQDIRDAKIANALAIIIGTEAADHVVRAITHPPTPADVRAGVRARHLTGWRKSHLFYPPANDEPGLGGCPPPPTTGGLGSGQLYWQGHTTLTEQGAALIQEMNRVGVLIDVAHLPTPLLTQLLDGRPNAGHQRNNAPIMDSHDFGGKEQQNASFYRSVAASGGGYGVIGYNFIRDFFPGGPDNVTAATIVAAMKDLKDIVGADHIVLGGDYFAGPYQFVPASLADVRSLTEEFVAQGFTDEEIRKVLGENMLSAYERAWDPTRGYSGGPARFYTCTNASTSAECLAARSHNGQGDFNHRPVTCLNNAAAGAVNLQLT